MKLDDLIDNFKNNVSSMVGTSLSFKELRDEKTKSTILRCDGKGLDWGAVREALKYSVINYKFEGGKVIFYVPDSLLIDVELVSTNAEKKISVEKKKPKELSDDVKAMSNEKVTQTSLLEKFKTSGKDLETFATDENLSDDDFEKLLLEI